MEVSSRAGDQRGRMLACDVEDGGGSGADVGSWVLYEFIEIDEEDQRGGSCNNPALKWRGCTEGGKGGRGGQFM